MIKFLGCFYLLSSAINPFLYSLFSKRFRRGFYDLIYRGKNSCTISCTTGNTTVRIGNNIPTEEKLANGGIKAETAKDLLQLTKLNKGNNGRQVITRQALCRHFNVESPSSYYVDEDINRMMYHKSSRSIYHGLSLRYNDSIISNPPCYSYANGEYSSKFRTQKTSRTRRFFNKSEGDDCSLVFRFSPPPSLVCQDESKSSRSENRSRTRSSTTEGRYSLQSSSDGKQKNCKYKVVFNNNRPNSSDAASGPISSQESKQHAKDDNIANLVIDLKYIDCSIDT